MENPVKEIVSEYEEKDDWEEEEEEEIEVDSDDETDTSRHINPKTLIKRYNFVLLISTNLGSLRFSSWCNSRVNYITPDCAPQTKYLCMY